MPPQGRIDDLTDAVLSAVESVPPGRVTSYGEVAAVVTERHASIGPRRVGAILREYGAAVPWHRVLHADGTAAPQIAREQAALLAAEGVPMPRGRVPVEFRHRF